MKGQRPGTKARLRQAIKEATIEDLAFCLSRECDLLFFGFAVSDETGKRVPPEHLRWDSVHGVFSVDPAAPGHREGLVAL